LDPIRSFIDRKTNGKVHIAYFEAKAIDLDYLNQKVVCKRIHMGLGEKGTDLEYIFNVDYDELIIAVGSHVNTFNTPGVKEYCHFLKEVHHAQNIRRQLWSNLERASCPSLSEDTIKQMLSIAVVGGGPTGVEFAGICLCIVYC
jgi:NADH:ubiquinone reductase (non-electrogenic)